MIRHRLVSPGQPLPLRLLLGLFEFLASSALATVVITLSAIVLIWATLVENHYGAPAAQFGFYQSTWFAVLLALLATNVLAATLIRFPWRRHQIGFLIVHAGILILLVGCWVSREKGINGVLVVYEGQIASRTLGQQRQFELTVDPDEEKDASPRTVRIPFEPGPFNWSDYGAMFWFPWRWVHRDCGTVYDADGVRVEVLDYCSDSRYVEVPRLRLRVADGDKPGRDTWREVALGIGRLRAPHGPHQLFILGSRERLAEGRWVTFRLAGGQVDSDAFLDSRPEGSLGRLGQIVLSADGEKHHFLVEDLQGKGPVPLGSSGLRVELTRWEPALLQVLLKVYAQDDTEPSGLLLLNAYRVNLDLQDHRNGVVGSYWFAAAEKPAKEEAAGQSKKPEPEQTTPVPPATARAAAEPRVDIIEGPDRRLYYRTWYDGRMGTIGRLPHDGSSIVVFQDTKSPMTLSVEALAPAGQPGYRVVPVEFEKDKPVKQERVKVRLRVDGNEREFWLADPFTLDAEQHSEKVEGHGRVAQLRLTRHRVDLGFRLRLRQAQKKLDPGTLRTAESSSHVDFLPLGEGGEPLQENVLITLNRPVRFVDPKSGHVFRLFQFDCQGPFRPGEPEFDRVVGGSRKRDELYRSVLGIAYDPGRQLKYAGCLMILGGIIVMYYMKAYFFRPRRKP